MKARRILVTGAGGMVGSYAKRVFLNDELLLTDTCDGSVHLDIRDHGAVLKTVLSFKPDIVLHLAAATDVDRCEQEPDWAYAVNAIGTHNVALACLEDRIPLVYISTAAVFSGDKPDPYIEFDAPNPANLYGRSKLAGEQVIRDLLERYYIVRAGWMIGGGERDKKFVGKIARMIIEGENPLQAVHDKWGSPTYAKDLLEGIQKLLQTGCYGLYHMVNKGSCSRYDVALVVQKALQQPEIRILPVSSDRFPLPAPRGRSEAMRNLKLELLGLDGMRSWQEAVQDYVQTELAPMLTMAKEI